MVYSLLLVDDEPYLADGLYELFHDSVSLELEVHKAYSGKSALGLCKSTKIDILLSDICMPDLTGLELMKKIRLQWPYCKIIFLTGHTDFEYMQNAIRYGSVDYILKTENDSQIVNAVQKAIGQIEEEKRNDGLLEKAREKLREAMPLLRERFLLDLLEGGIYSKNEMARHFSGYETGLNEDSPVLLLLGRIDCWPAAIDKTEKTGVMYGVRNIAEKYLESSYVKCAAVTDKEWLLWFVQPTLATGRDKEEDLRNLWDRIILFVQGMMDPIQQSCRELFGLSASFMVSSEPTAWEQAGERYGSLKLAFDRSSGMSPGMLLIDGKGNHIFRADDTFNSEDQGVIRFQIKKLEMLKEYLEGCEKNRFFETFKGFANIPMQYPSLPFSVGIEILYSFSSMFMEYIHKRGLMQKVSEKVDLRLLMGVEKASSLQEAMGYFKVLAEALFELRSSESFLNVSRVFAFIKSYTEQNLDKELSLTRLADELHFNPSYLSRLFKHVTGKSVSEYIAEIKINKARELLSKSNMKINEIAGSLGFESSSYFTRFFKKYTDLGPQEYRDSIN
jgi:two-component system, response regulator YesN